jgi:predicted alpha/beta-hydrolase family hydrolase
MPSHLERTSLQLLPTPQHGPVSALFCQPEGARTVLVLGHGAGSTLQHRLVEELSLALAERGVASLRFNYPYSERGRGMDSEPVRLATVRAAAALGVELSRGRPLFAGGHSMSGRMFTLAQSKEPLPGVSGLICFAFPLHPGAPDAQRAAHLKQVQVPLLFLSGTRDKMADKALLASVVAGVPAATLRLLDTADHGFVALKSRTSSEPVLAEAARSAAEWMEEKSRGG